MPPDERASRSLKTSVDEVLQRLELDSLARPFFTSAVELIESVSQDPDRYLTLLREEQDGSKSWLRFLSMIDIVHHRLSNQTDEQARFLIERVQEANERVMEISFVSNRKGVSNG